MQQVTPCSVSYPGCAVTCTTATTTSFSLDVTEFSGTGTVTWGGTFQVTTDDGTHSADIVGSFRGISTPQ